MTPAGERNKRITFERATSTRGGLGQPGARTWASIGAARWAKVLYGTGAERRAASVEGAVQSATFRVLADSLTRGVLVTDRISFDGLVWDIGGIAPIGGPVAYEIEFTATASRG